MNDSHEESLRRALRESAEEIHPGPEGWEQIEFRAAAARRRARFGTRAMAALGTAAAVLVAVVAVASLTGDDDGTDVAAGPPEGALTTVPGPPTVEPADEEAPGIYPFRTASESDSVSSDQWNDPVFTAERFLRDYVGFTRLIMGEFQQGDSRSGEVTATTRKNGPVTTVLVRQLGSNGGPFTVVGATTDNIVLERPTAMEEVTSPVHIEGRSTAFEGNVVIEVREDGQLNKDGNKGLTPLIGGSMGEMGPLLGDVPFAHTEATGGAVIAYTDSAMDGAREEASVVRVLFAGSKTAEPERRPG